MPKFRVLTIWLVITVLVIPQLVWVARQEMRVWTQDRLRKALDVSESEPYFSDSGYVPEWLPGLLRERWRERFGAVTHHDSPGQDTHRILTDYGGPFEVEFKGFPTVEDWDLMSRYSGTVVLRVGSQIHSPYNREPLPPVDTLLRLAQDTRIEWMSFTGFAIGRDQFQALTSGSQLTNLSINLCDLESGSIQVLAGHPTLRSLSLDGTEVGLRDLEALKDIPELKALYLGGQLLPHHLEVISQTTNLRVLQIDSSTFTDSDLDILLPAPHLDLLYLVSTPVSMAKVEEVKSQYPKLALLLGTH